MSQSFVVVHAFVCHIISCVLVMFSCAGRFVCCVCVLVWIVWLCAWVCLVFRFDLLVDSCFAEYNLSTRSVVSVSSNHFLHDGVWLFLLKVGS